MSVYLPSSEDILGQAELWWVGTGEEVPALLSESSESI